MLKRYAHVRDHARQAAIATLEATDQAQDVAAGEFVAQKLAQSADSTENLPN
jgi:hypothetical protein